MPLNTNDRLYEWEGLGELWITSEESFDTDYPSKPQKEGDSVAKWVVDTVFGLELSDDSSEIGGTLPGYDIIGRDPYDVINLSLISQIVEDGSFYECYMDGDGIVKFYKIGEDASSIGPHILYSIDNGEVKMKCDNVMVTGYDPPPKRYTGNSFDLLRFANTINQSYYVDYQDEDYGKYPLITMFNDVLGPEACSYSYEGQIEYGGNPDFFDGIDPKAMQCGEGGACVYDPTKFEEVVSYLYKIDIPFFNHSYTKVTFSDTSVRYEDIGGFGKLQTRNWVDNTAYICKFCIDGKLSVPDSEVGLRLPRSNERKFKGVSDVYIYGYRLNSIEPDRILTGYDSEDMPIIEPGPADFLVTLDTMLNEPFKLSRDEDYIIVQDSDDPEYSKIAFSCNVSANYLEKFGGVIGNDGSVGQCSYRINMSCIYGSPYDSEAGSSAYVLAALLKAEDGSDYREGYLNDVNYTDLVSSQDVHYGVIFPVGEGGSGYVVTKVVVVYQWDNPSITIYDQRNDLTLDSLSTVEAYFYAMLKKDEPSPIAFSGPGTGNAELLDPNQVRPDYNQNTVQNFEITEYQRAMSSMEAGDVRVTMPFANGEECIIIANKIKDLQTDVARDIVYTCSPDAEPVLGEVINDGVINEIDYSYQDSSQYLITVTAGPQWRGGQSWDNSLYKMTTDNITMTGTVLSVTPENIKANVNINKVGVMECINGTKNILGPGDKVKVTLYNNPVAL